MSHEALPTTPNGFQPGGPDLCRSRGARYEEVLKGSYSTTVQEKRPSLGLGIASCSYLDVPSQLRHVGPSPRPSACPRSSNLGVLYGDHQP